MAILFSRYKIQDLYLGRGRDFILNYEDMLFYELLYPLNDIFLRITKKLSMMLFIVDPWREYSFCVNYNLYNNCN
jgi:hypothetical protein